MAADGREQEAAPIRVMVVDDHPMWREGVARDLAEAGYDVVATTGEGRQAVRICAAARPQVVVLDLQLPDVSGVEVIRGLHAARPGVRVLMLSASGEQQSVLDAVKAGATGYLVKSASPAEFLDAVARTAAPSRPAALGGGCAGSPCSASPGWWSAHSRRPARSPWSGTTISVRSSGSPIRSRPSPLSNAPRRPRRA